MEVILDFLSGNTAIFIYIALFVILMLCGVGLPLPEDIPLLVGGYLAYAGQVNLLIVLFVSIVGILIGDTIIYHFGSTYGYDIANTRLLRRVFTKKRLARAQHFFTKHGQKAVFFGRFVAGVRAATFFVAGMMKVSYSRFIVLDTIAALLSVPLFVLLAYYLGENLERAARILDTVKYSISGAVLIAVVVFTIAYLFKKRKAKAAAARYLDDSVEESTRN